MFTIGFLKAMFERAIKTFAEALAAILVADPIVGLVDVAWGDALSVSGLAALVSVLLSIASSATGSGPSLTNSERLTE